LPKKPTKLTSAKLVYHPQKKYCMPLYLRLLGWLVLSWVSLTGCITLKGKDVSLATRFADSPQPPPPDYANPDHWAALPTRSDNADRYPTYVAADQQSIAAADVFYIYPTLYSYKPTLPNQWNADVKDAYLNRQIDELAILNQASIFNGSGKVYAPRYRQAHLYAYKTPYANDSIQAFALAYEDVKTAFQYYLDHFNQGRPILIAAHSQGTNHATRLVKEFFDGQPLQKQLIAAYLVGIPTAPDAFITIRPCQQADDTGCFVSWCTYAEGYYPPNYAEKLQKAACINPVNWQIDPTLAASAEHQGSVLWKFKPSKPHRFSTRIEGGMVWITKPKIPFGFLLKVKNWHQGDYNLFYFNVRQNAQKRTQSYLNQTQK